MSVDGPDQLAMPFASSVACPRCGDTGAIGEAWCDCPAAARRQSELRRQHEAAQRVGEELDRRHQEACLRLMAALVDMPDDLLTPRLLRVTQAIALFERAHAIGVTTYVGEGRRMRQGRARAARAARELSNQLVDQFRVLVATFDEIEHDLYHVFEVSREGRDRQAVLFASIASVSGASA